MLRYRIIMPYNTFRAQIFVKNVAPPEDLWAEGVLCAMPDGSITLLNNRLDDNAYRQVSICFDTLGMNTGFTDGDERSVFEGDIVRFRFFSEDEEQPAPDNEMSEQPFPEDGFFPDTFGEDDEEEERPKRPVYSDIPEGKEMISEFTGVVYMSGGMFFVQYFDESIGGLSYAPLWPAFGPDMRPAKGTAVKIIGNLYDDEALFSEVLHLSPQ